MKKLILILFLLTKFTHAQWVPLKVNEIMYDRVGQDTIKTHHQYYSWVWFENFRYKFKVTGDSNLIHWDLVDKQKEFNDPWKGVGIAYFGMMYSSLLVIPYTLPSDKIYHLGVGALIGGGANYGIYSITKKRWLGFWAGAGTGCLIGAGKEYLWDKNMGGTVSNKDFLVTCIGSFIGSLGVRIVLK